MAIRLPVVVSQSARRDARAVDLEESLITQLMLSPGIDAALVASLDSIQLDSTDHLCLQDIGQEIVLAAWLTLESAETAWLRLRLDGQLQPFGISSLSSSAIATGAVRRIRYLPLTPQTRVDEVIAQLQQILASRKVHTFSIQLSSVSAPMRPESPPERSSQHVAPLPRPLSPSPAVVNVFEKSSLDKTAALAPEVLESQRNDWDDLDKLVDDLDALDL